MRFWVISAAASIALIVIATACLGATPERPPEAKPWDVALKLNLQTKHGAISAYEPLVAELEYRNVSGGTVWVVMDVGVTTLFEIADAKGKVLAATPKREQASNYIYVPIEIPPGESRSNRLVLTALYTLKRPGVYSVRVRQFGLSENSPAIAETSCAFRVLPFNSARLDARCAELLKMGIGPNWSLKALYSMRHDVALPYLDRMVREWSDKYAVLTMRRIGTRKAKALIDSYLARKDSVGHAARIGMKMSKDRDVAWEMNQY